MKTFDITFEVTVSVEAESEEQIDYKFAALKAGSELHHTEKEYITKVEEYIE